MSLVPFVTCDLLDDHPDKDIQVVTPSLDGRFFKSYGARKTFGGQIVTVKCFEDNSRVKELLATDGTGKVLVVDGGASMRCALMGDMIAESAVKITGTEWSSMAVYVMLMRLLSWIWACMHWLQFHKKVTAKA